MNIYYFTSLVGMTTALLSVHPVVKFFFLVEIVVFGVYSIVKFYMMPVDSKEQVVERMFNNHDTCKQIIINDFSEERLGRILWCYYSDRAIEDAIEWLEEQE
jgi:hypothetical protein